MFNHVQQHVLNTIIQGLNKIGEIKIMLIHVHHNAQKHVQILVLEQDQRQLHRQEHRHAIIQHHLRSQGVQVQVQ